MAVRFTNSYVEKLFAERDLLGLYQLIGLVGAERQLPEPFWLFCRLLEWSGSTRSGVWQYYEVEADDLVTKVSQALERWGLSEIAQRYQSGRDSWDGPNRAADLDAWIDAHEREIEDAAFGLIATRKDDLMYDD